MFFKFSNNFLGKENAMRTAPNEKINDQLVRSFYQKNRKKIRDYNLSDMKLYISVAIL